MPGIMRDIYLDCSICYLDSLWRLSLRRDKPYNLERVKHAIFSYYVMCFVASKNERIVAKTVTLNQGTYYCSLRNSENFEYEYKISSTKFLDLVIEFIESDLLNDLSTRPTNVDCMFDFIIQVHLQDLPSEIEHRAEIEKRRDISIKLRLIYIYQNKKLSIEIQYPDVSNISGSVTKYLRSLQS